MDEAIRFAKEIIRKYHAVNKTKSKSLKRDYQKSIQRDLKDLTYYCNMHLLDFNVVMHTAIEYERR